MLMVHKHVDFKVQPGWAASSALETKLNISLDNYVVHYQQFFSSKNNHFSSYFTGLELPRDSHKHANPDALNFQVHPIVDLTHKNIKLPFYAIATTVYLCF